MEILEAEDILTIHQLAINPNELPGLAGNKSLEAVIARVENRINYGLVKDVFDLASTYAVVIAIGRVFNDANKRTAYQAMTSCLEINGVNLDLRTEEIGSVIIKVAQGLIDEAELAKYLRQLK